MRNIQNELQQALLEEQTYQFNYFSNEMAFEIAKRVYEQAREAQWPIAFDITRSGQRIVYFAMKGTSPDNDEWIRRKNNVVNRFGHSSRYVGLHLESKGTTIVNESFLDFKEYIPYGGAFPIIMKETGVIGTMTVSGLSENGDHEAVIMALQSLFSARANQDLKQ